MKSHSLGGNHSGCLLFFLQLLLIADCDFCPLLIATVDRDCLLLIVWGRCWWERRKRGRWLPPGSATTTTTRVWVFGLLHICRKRPQFANSGAGLLVGTLWTMTSRSPVFFHISHFGICHGIVHWEGRSSRHGDDQETGQTPAHGGRS